MSMAGGDAAMQLDFTVNTTQLDRALSEADRRITAATRGTGNTIDRLMEKVSQGIGAKLTGAITSGLALNVIDKALRAVAEGIKTGGSAAQIGEAVANGIVEAVRGIPVAGALMDISSTLADRAIGGPMERDVAIARAQESMRQREELLRKGIDAMGELEVAGATDPEILARAERAREVSRLRAIADRAKAGRVQIVDGVEQELEPGIIARARELVAKGLGIYDEKVRVATEERRKRDAERIAAEEERRIREQEEAYSRFIEGNTQEAILALEAQLQAAGTAAAPTRADRLAQLMAGMTGGIATADTALGAFTFATGDPAQISRDILENAQKQLATLERIEGIQREIATLQKGTGFN